MKVLHISTNDSTGAGLCAYRIHSSLLNLGIDSKMLVLDKTQLDNCLICRKKYKVKSWIYRAFHKFLRLLHIYVFEFDKVIKQSKESGSLYSLPISIFNLSKDPLVNDADIIHLHWADGFVDYPSFLKTLKKPIVWTLHDESLFYGTSHYSDAVLYNDPLEKKYYRIKHEMVASAEKLKIVFLSKYFLDSFKDEEILKGKSIYVVNNSVDPIKFRPIKDVRIRKDLGISYEAILLAFVAGRIDDPHKGLSTLLDAISYFSGKDIKVLAIGGNSGTVYNEKVISVGLIRDSEQMSKLLSISDYFVMPSLQEAFSQAPLEALACGTPVIVSPVSGTEELVTPENGVICKGFSVNDIVNGLEIAFNTVYDRCKVRESVLTHFSPDFIAHKYVDIYKSSL